MRFIRYAILALIGIVLIAIAIANREIVTLQLLPSGLADILGSNWSVDLPLFLVILGGVLLGLLIGFVWEWRREHRHRAEMRRNARKAKELDREVRRLKHEKHDQDDVLALLD